MARTDGGTDGEGRVIERERKEENIYKLRRWCGRLGGGGGRRRNLVSVRPNAAHNNNVNTRGRRSRRRSHRVTSVFVNYILFLRIFFLPFCAICVAATGTRHGRTGRTVRENGPEDRPSNSTHALWSSGRVFLDRTGQTKKKSDRIRFNKDRDWTGPNE